MELKVRHQTHLNNLARIRIQNPLHGVESPTLVQYDVEIVDIPESIAWS